MASFATTVFGLWSQVLPDRVGIWKALKAVSQRLDGRVGDRRKGSPRYPYNYNTGSAGVVGGTGYPACNWGGVLL
jgi:hypothetical protein